MSFNAKAKDWDNDPGKVERAKVFAAEIVNYIQPDNTMKALEFGCGTGLLSFHLKDFFNSVTLVDTSENMLDVLQEKIDRENLTNFKPVLIDLLNDKLNDSDFDLIYTLMTMHHIIDLDKILTKFSALLKTGGYLCIADLVKEDGSFHSNVADFNGHNGFDKNELTKILDKNGFEVIFYKICYEIEKDNRKYPLFLMIGKKM